MRVLVYGLPTLGLAALVAWLWPEAAGLGVSIVLGAGFVFGLWGALNLNSGIWCAVTRRAAPGGDAVALTYDDGPDPVSTPPLLDLLEERGVRATFFCVGEKVRAHPELVRRMAEAGHELGNHCDSHSKLTNFFTGRRLAAEVDRCQVALREASGTQVRYFRPPFGHTNHATEATARERELEVIGWQVRGLDVPGRDPAAVAERILAELSAGGIALLHDGDREPELVLGATRAVLDGLEARGWRGVTLSELLGR